MLREKTGLKLQKPGEKDWKKARSRSEEGFSAQKSVHDTTDGERLAVLRASARLLVCLVAMTGSTLPLHTDGEFSRSEKGIEESTPARNHFP